jgi:Fe-S cluster assembly protein SufD
MTPAAPAATEAPLLQLATPPTTPDEPAWLRGQRESAQAWLALNGLPHHKDEAWKYTPVRELAKFAPATRNGAASSAASAVDVATVDALAGTADGARIVLVNGAFVPELSTLGPAGASVTLHAESALPEAPTAELPIAAVATRDQSRFDGFQALGRLAATDGLVLDIASETSLADPVTVVHVTAPGGTALANHLHLTVNVGSGSHVTIAEVFVGADDPAESGHHHEQNYLTNAATAIVVGRNATLTHAKVQLESPGSSHVSHTAIRLAAGANAETVSVALGAEIGRNAIDVTLQGEGASTFVKGLYLPTGTQKLDNAVTVEHLASHGTSDQLFKAVADGKGKGSFIGRILVQPGTVATDANQTSRSLLLSRTAEADTRPWLEIFADDVACTHGAAVGQLDHEALFYLRTRGIPEAEARTMLIGAFISEIVDAVPVPALRERIEQAIAAKFALSGNLQLHEEVPA